MSVRSFVRVTSGQTWMIPRRTSHRLLLLADRQSGKARACYALTVIRVGPAIISHNRARRTSTEIEATKTKTEPAPPSEGKRHCVMIFRKPMNTQIDVRHISPKSSRGATKTWLSKRGGTLSYLPYAPQSLRTSAGHGQPKRRPGRTNKISKF